MPGEQLALYRTLPSSFRRHGLTHTPHHMALHLLLSLALTSNTGCGRWWEARIVWGQMLNVSRNLTRQVAMDHHADGTSVMMMLGLMNGMLGADYMGLCLTRLRHGFLRRRRRHSRC